MSTATMTTADDASDANPLTGAGSSPEAIEEYMAGLRSNLDLEAEAQAYRRAVLNRLKRAYGQLGGLIQMVEDGRECRDVLIQFTAVSKAIDRAGYKVVAALMREAIVAGNETGVDADEIEELFLRLA